MTELPFDLNINKQSTHAAWKQLTTKLTFLSSYNALNLDTFTFRTSAMLV